MSSELRYAYRALRRRPAFAATAIVTLAIGIGATTAVSSIAHSVLLRPLPYPNADRLVRVWEEHPGGQAILGNRWISNRTYHAWMKQPRTIDVLGGFRVYERTIRVQDEDVPVFGSEVSPALIAALGARPRLGRLFVPGDADDGTGRVVLISEALWRQRLSADADTIGRVLPIDGESHVIVGVVADPFHFPDAGISVWLPYRVQAVSSDPALSQRTSGLSAIARIAAGATPAQVEAEGTAMARSVPVTSATQLLFGRGGPPVVRTRPLVSDVTGDVKPALLVLLAAVGCVLLIACANVANLVLARGLARQRELAVRAAIGAGRGRLARQLLAECGLLSLAGGVLGVAIAWLLVRLIPVFAPARFPRLDELRLDGWTLAFASGAVFVALIVAGLVPAWRGARFDLAEALRGGDGAIAGGVRTARARRLRDGLLVGESAFAVLLLVGASLLARSFVALINVDPGYTADRVLTARVLMPPESPPARAAAFIDASLERLRAQPGVIAAGAGNMMPMVLMTAVTSLTLPESVLGAGVTSTRSVSYAITPGYAEALGLRLMKGRLFEPSDTTSGTRVFLVNEEFVRQYLGGTDRVGETFPANLYVDEQVRPTSIVGVVRNTLKNGNDQRPQPEAYFLHGAHGRRIEDFVNLVIRTSGDPAAMTASVRQLIRAVDPAVTIERVEPLSDRVAASVAQPRFAAGVMVAFAAVALVLASIGVYGVLSYSVSQRRRELALRAALGASRGSVLLLVAREGLLLTGLGAVIGLAGAAALTRLMQSALFGVTPLDRLSFLAAGATLLLVATLACLLPARRAAAVDPNEALRSE